MTVISHQQIGTQLLVKWFSSLELRAKRPWVNRQGVGAQEGQLWWNPSGATLFPLLWITNGCSCQSSLWILCSEVLCYLEGFRQQLVENVGAWVWEVERAAVASSAPSVWKVPPSVKAAEVIRFHFHSWTKTGLLSGSFLFNDFHEKAFIQALTWLSEYTFQCKSA